MATANRKTDDRVREQDERARAARARAEVVDILASAILTLILQGRMPPRPGPEAEQQGECS